MRVARVIIASSGAWFYEVMVFTAGILQIGWATKHCLFESEVRRRVRAGKTGSVWTGVAC